MEYKKFMAGGLSGLVEISFTYPIDYTKVKRQEFKQTGKSLTNFYKNIAPNGIKSYYTGFFPRVAGIVPMRFVFWGSQDTTKQLLHNNNINTPFNFFIIGACGGFFQAIIDNQIEILKISKITNASRSEMFRSLMKFQGFNTTLVRNIGFNSCVSYLCFRNGSEEQSSWEKVRNGALGGLIGSILTQPIDYVKTQKHRSSDTRPMLTILKETIKENPKKLYTGGVFRAIYNFSTMGIGFVAYDFIKKNI